ncbi:MAG: cytochrome c [Alphaproteobacteria bacterium]
MIATLMAASIAMLSIAFSAPASAQLLKPDAVKRGQYLTRASDCMACHTSPGGTPFAGGLQINTPFGMLTTPNITPDVDTGIGAWSDDQFYRALHEGIGRHGQDLYPVFPYTSFTKMTRDDVLAIKAFLFSLTPVYAPRAPSAMAFPFNIRSTLMVWRELFFTEGTFQPDPKQSAEWNRGAYLVQGPGHCGECHSPRNVFGAVEQSKSLSGGLVDHWLAPNISSNPITGLGDWKVQDIVTLLKKGSTKSEGVVFGPMSLVVHDSLRYLTDSDLKAIAVYLKSTPERGSPAALASPPAATMAKSARLYLENCAECHQAKGVGLPGAVPNLAGNPVITQAEPNDIIIAILKGLQPRGNYGGMPSFAASLGDQNIADLANYVRTAWVNKAAPNATAALVAKLRGDVVTSPAGSEAARAFECPRVSTTGAVNAIADPGFLGIMNSITDENIDNKTEELFRQLKTSQPGISDTDLVNTMLAAYCPVVAKSTGLSYTAKRARLTRFTSSVERLLSASDMPAGAKILIQVPVAPELLQKIDQAASQAKQSREAWIEKMLTKDAGGP